MGKVIADVQVYKDFSEYLLTCDAAARELVSQHLSEIVGPDVNVEDRSERQCAIAIEGPGALSLPAKLLGAEVGGLAFTRFIAGRLEGVDVTLARVGYTAEFGYVIFAPLDRAGDIRAAVMRAAPSAQECYEAVHPILRLEVRSFNRQMDLLRVCARSRPPLDD